MQPSRVWYRQHENPNGCIAGLAAGDAGVGSVQPRPQVININTATRTQLEALPGIGPKIAAEIIKNRPYRDSKELMDKVKGIGPKTWQEIRRYVRFSR